MELLTAFLISVMASIVAHYMQMVGQGKEKKATSLKRIKPS